MGNPDLKALKDCKAIWVKKDRRDFKDFKAKQDHKATPV